jgi:hypothetical protein
VDQTVPIGIAIAGHQVATELTVTRGLPGIVTVRQVPGQRLVAVPRVKPLANMDHDAPTEPPNVALRWRLSTLTGGVGAWRPAALHVAIDRHGFHLPVPRRPRPTRSQSGPLSSRLDLP